LPSLFVSETRFFPTVACHVRQHSVCMIMLIYKG